MEDEEEGVVSSVNSLRTIWVDKDSEYHRLHGPAVEYSSGDCSWYRHGQRHRDDGPAKYWPSEDIVEWYKHGERYEPTAHEIIAWKMKKEG